MATPEITLFFDGDCPLCSREIEFLRKRDERRVIEFIDIARPEFIASDYGLTQQALMDEIHARLADGTMLTGVEVFRQLYSRLGFSPLVWLSRAPGVAQLLQLGYRVWAKNRLRWTGRCEDGVCSLPSHSS